MRLQGKVAFVTGGASGIGAATARRLAAEGASVAIGDLNEQGAKDVAGELDGFGCALDVADRASVSVAVAGAVDALGDIDVLVNNAGTDRFSFFVNTDEALWDLVLGVNLRGTMAVTHAVLGRMQERRVGSIVNVASEAGRVGSQGSAVYSAAKAGVIGFTKAIEDCVSLVDMFGVGSCKRSSMQPRARQTRRAQSRRSLRTAVRRPQRESWSVVAEYQTRRRLPTTAAAATA